MNALQQHEIDELEQLPLEKDRFTINSIEEVNWALRKLAVIQTKEMEVQQLADAEIQRITSWARKEREKLQNTIDFFQSLLAEYAMKQRLEDEKYKKTSTPYGTVKFKKNPDKWNYDDAQLINSLKNNGLQQFIRIKEEPNKVELKKSVAVINGTVVDSQTGTIIEGITVVPQPETVVVEVAK